MTRRKREMIGLTSERDFPKKGTFAQFRALILEQ
jgi:hypothetical protein